MATVDGRKIFRTDVDKYYDNNVASAQQPPSGEQATALRLNILHQMIDDQIIMGWAYWLSLLLLLVAGTLLRFRCLDCKPFWFDECFSVEVARIGWRNFLHLMWWREANMAPPPSWTIQVAAAGT